jgi:phenylalanyl-tRNA synthetase beta chain
MKFTISWLEKFLDTNATQQQIIEGLTNLGLEVEEVINQADIYAPFIVAEIISIDPHPEADKLRICKVNNGKKIIQIVCGAPNARAGIKVVLAPIGAEIPSNGLKIKESKIRNISSYGMLCSGSELNLSEESDGILELEEKHKVGELFSESYGLNETLIEISVTPNRGDCLGVYGIARDLSAAGFGELKPLDSEYLKGNFKSPISVDISSSKAPKYIGRYFKNVENKASPQWLQNALKSIGLAPISALVDITNYFTFAFGRPLHVFDADKISKIEVREANEGESFTALNDKEYKLNAEELVIADGAKILGLAGIIGEKESSVSMSTKNIFLEIGLFDADSVTKAARAHQIDTDAKFRFERKIDSEFMTQALDLATKMIIEIAGGDYSEAVIVNNLDFKPTKVEFHASELKKRIGVEYEQKTIDSILLSLGFKSEGSIYTVPSWRHDITSKEDIVEEVARIHGYNNIPAIALPISNNLSTTLDMKQRNIYRMQRFAASLGLDEVVTWSFMNSKRAELFSELKTELHLKNPISNELNYMRPSIVPNLLEVAHKNQNRGMNDIQIFELGSIFTGINPDQQMLSLAGLRVGNNNERNIYGDMRKVDLFDSKDDIFKSIAEVGLDPSKLQYRDDKAPGYYHPGRSSALALGKNIIGYFGELHPSIIKAYDLNNNAVAFELLIDNMPVSKSKFGRKGPLKTSDYQAVERDFAFIVKQDISVDLIMRSASQVDKKLIKSVDIFDIYSGKGVDEGDKSVALRVIIQASDRTLAENELEQLSAKIIDSVSKETEGRLR